jgi:hypothetical protein
MAQASLIHLRVRLQKEHVRFCGVFQQVFSPFLLLEHDPASQRSEVRFKLGDPANEITQLTNVVVLDGPRDSELWATCQGNAVEPFMLVPQVIDDIVSRPAGLPRELRAACHRLRRSVRGHKASKLRQSVGAPGFRW